jgi:hypothetical protein
MGGVTIKDYLMGRGDLYLLPQQVVVNAAKLLDKINPLLKEFGEDRRCTSGWRPAELNAKVPGAAKTSKHITGDAIDLEDVDGKLKEWCVFNQDKLEALGLYMEHPEATPTWVHLQQLPPRSGNRIFRP